MGKPDSYLQSPLWPSGILLFLMSCLLPFAAEAGDRYDRKNSAENQFIVRAGSDQIEQIAYRVGLKVASAAGDEEESVFLVEGPAYWSPELIEDLVKEERDVLSFERVELASLPEAGDPELEHAMAVVLDQSMAAILESADTTGPSRHKEFNKFFGVYDDCQDISLDCPWAGYTDQPAAQLLRIHEGHGLDKIFGHGIVAVMDTGIDPNHPALKHALVPGYDFVLEQPGTASDWSNLDQSMAVILEQSMTAILEQSMSAILEGSGEAVILNQSVAAILEQSMAVILEELDLPPAFGHGTMVAGVIRLVAPGAKIMPLRVFDGEGTAHPFDIIRAIYFAVDNGANVINMSFSMKEFSPELLRAVNYAYKKGVICVASAGNAGSDTLVYPAAFGNAVGVASTDLVDGASPFTNYGSDLVSLSAPGEAIITTFPGGIYAASFGTSFSAPFVAGAAALLTKPKIKTDLEDDDGKKVDIFAANAEEAVAFMMRFSLLQTSDDLPERDLGAGRLNIYRILKNKIELKLDKDHNEVKVKH